jgi:preprotein translocase subunit SecA
MNVPMRQLLDRLRNRPVFWRPEQTYGARLREIERLEPRFRSLTDDGLRAACGLVRASVAETFALVREAADRVLSMRPYDVQLIAGLAMNDGHVAELATGEGKTLAAVAPTIVHATSGRGAHVLTFNDYLARRDAAWMGPLYDFFGLSVGVIQEDLTPEERRRAYAADVTYATAKEVGFDFLRGMLVQDRAELAQRPFHYAIVDEADSILIDEARVPLVIAGQLDESLEDLGSFAVLAREMRSGEHYAIDTDDARNVTLTDDGLDFAQRGLGVPDLLGNDQVDTLTRIHAALHALCLLQRDVDYLVSDGRIELIDEFTGRVAEDRHLPDGLQAAVDAKEGLVAGRSGTVLGSTTLQHLLDRYEKLAGMTATAYTSCDELKEFYGLTTVLVPPNKPSIRIDEPDRVFETQHEKQLALVEEIASAHRTRRPVLVGTASVAESERLATALGRAGVACRVLNARNDDDEATIIADAGKLGAVTISTNMAGRGTDIRLGGANEDDHDKVVGLGGLYVIGTNRHESRRIDDQLRGRAGRQGDPGSTRFFISLEDPILERFDVLGRIPEAFRTSVDHPVVRREIERTQRIVDGQNVDIRRTLSRYSDMIEQQGVQLQERRDAVLDGSAPSILDAPPGVERTLSLALIDRAWRDHLAYVTELRDSIHLRRVALLDPLAEFQQEVIQAFADRIAGLERERIETFERATIGPGGIDLDDLGLGAPSSTWTYIVSDDPFRDQLFSKVGGTAMGIGLVVNFPLVVAWWLYRRSLRK